MNALLKINMTEVTRLTCEGRLDEALAVLRGEFPAPKPAVDCKATAEHSDEPSGRRTLPLIDMAPPTSAGGVWSAQFTEQPTTPSPDDVSTPTGRKPLRGMIDGMGKLGTMPGLPGMRGVIKHRAAAPLPKGAQFMDRSYANEAGQRAYKLYVPSTYRGQTVPLIIMLHGCTQSADDFAAGTRMNELAEEQTFVVAYPAQDQSANPSKCWNWFNAGDQQRDRGEPSLIAGITRQILSEFSVDPSRVYIAGLSAGGAAAAIMGSAYPDLYAAIGVHSGLACGAASDMPGAFAAMRNGSSGPSTRPRGYRAGAPVPTIVFHGDGDKTVSPINGDHVIAQAKGSASLRPTVRRAEAPGGATFTCTVHTDGDGQAVLEHWVLNGVGHAWSGGSDAGSYTEPRGPDASREMLRFFLDHRLK